MTSFIISAHSFHRKWRLFRNCFIAQLIKFKFGTGIQKWMMILNFGSKSGLGDDFGQYVTQKPLFLDKHLLEIAFAIATPKVIGDQKVLEMVCYMLKLKVTKFQLPTSNGF